MSEEIRVTYTAELMRRVVRAYWWRSIGPLSTVATTLCAIATLLGLLRNDRSWVIGVFGSFAVMGALVSVSVYRAHLRNALTRIKRLDGQSAHVIISEETFAFRSNRGTGTYQWGMFKEVWMYDDFWLLMVARNEFITLPVSSRNLDTLSIAASALKTHGVQVRRRKR